MCSVNMVAETLIKCSIFMKNGINSLQVKCCFSPNGCDWIGTLEKYEEHTENCPLELVECPLFKLNACETCDGNIFRKDFESHLFASKDIFPSKVFSVLIEHKEFFASNLVYNGEMKSNLPHGHGIEKRFVKDYIGGGCSFYCGEWVNGKINGYGFCKKNNFWYEGYWEDKLRHGFGTTIEVHKTSGSVAIYTGQWEKNVMVGKGVIKYEHSCYSGEVLNCQKHGKGVLIQRNGTSFDGTWCIDKLRGFCVKRVVDSANGGITIFEGTLTDDGYEGFCKISYACGTIFEGDVKSGLMHGKGKMTWTDGNSYDGDFVNGSRTGIGRLTYSDRDYYYVGEFKDNMFHGKGKRVYGESGFGHQEHETWENGNQIHNCVVS